MQSPEEGPAKCRVGAHIARDRDQKGYGQDTPVTKGWGEKEPGSKVRGPVLCWLSAGGGRAADQSPKPSSSTGWPGSLGKDT